MRRDEFPVIDKVREKDMEYLIEKFKELCADKALTSEMKCGVSTCIGITGIYLDKIRGREEWKKQS